MNRCLIICGCFVAPIASGCSAVDATQPPQASIHQPNASGRRCLTIEDVSTGEVVEDRPTDKAWLRLPWMVPLLRRDLVDAWGLIESAERAYDPAHVLFIDGRTGVLHTRLGDYRFHVGEEKTASGVHWVSLYPAGEPDGRDEMHWSLPNDEGQRLTRLLDQRLADNAPLAKRQGYVSKRL